MKSGINHFNKASKIYADDAERERQKRTGKTKLGMVGAGLAAGAAVGSVIPGIGTIAGGLIGAGAGGLGAILGGEAISSWLGGLLGSKDAQEKVLADMGNNLRDAVNEYTRITSQNDYARQLIKEYEDLAEAMNGPGLSNQEAVQIQERMQDIGLQLHEIFPDLINDYDILNGKTGERISLLKEEATFMDASAKRHLQQSVTDAKTKLPELQKEIPELEKKIEAASNQYESSNQFRTELYKILREAQEVYDDPLATPKQLEQANVRVVSRANKLSSSLGREDSFKDYGDVTKTYHGLESETAGLIEELDNLESKLSEAQQSLRSYYDSSVQLIWSDTGIDMDQFQSAKKNMESLQKAMIELVQSGSVSKETEVMVNEIIPGFSMAGDAASQMDLLKQGIEGMKDSIQPAIDQIDELNRSLEMLPEEKKIKVSIEAQGSIPIPGRTGLDVIPTASKTGSAASGKIGKRAEGGFTQGPELTWIGEDGAEAVIPLSGKYRKRGLELYEKVGKYLGVGYHAEGGVFDSTSGDSEPAFFDTGTTRSADPISGGVSAASGTSLTVHVSANPETQIHVNGGNSMEEIMARLRQTFEGMTDQLLAEIAKKILMVSENMPGGVV